MITVVDYDAGNILSVMNALARIGKSARLACDPFAVERADFVLLPGVGAFGAAMRSLKKRELDKALKARFAANRPTLGICLGLQLLFEGSDESGGERGLELLKGRVCALPEKDNTVPHIGWSTVRNCSGEFAPFENEYFYFVHGYAAMDVESGFVAAYSDYGAEFAAAVACGNTVACQFHPEKSGAKGLELLRRLTKEARE